MSSISSIPSSSSAAAQAQASLPQQTLNQQDFLQLLVAQLSQQDPMNPESDTDFAAQMAQFSALQTSQTMQGNVAGLQANGLIGATVQLQPTQGSPVTGIVSSVQYSDGTPSLIVNGQAYTMSQVLSVAPASVSTASPTASTTSPTPSPSAAQSQSQ